MCSPTKNVGVHSAILAVLLLVLVALLMRLPGIPWGIADGDFFEPDEFQHTNYASLQLRKMGIPINYAVGSSRPGAFGTQISILALAGREFGMDLSDVNLVLLGRLLSLFYGVFLPPLIYLFVKHVFQSHRAGLIAGLVLAVSDLHVTYSHYGVPEASHAFWFFFSVLFLVLYSRGRTTVFVRAALGIGLGMCLATKFDPTSLLAFVLVLALERPFPIIQKIVDLILISAVSILTLVASYLTDNIGTYVASVKAMSSANFDIIKDDHHLLYNPLLYISAIIAGTSVPVFLTALLGLAGYIIHRHKTRKDIWDNRHRSFRFYF